MLALRYGTTFPISDRMRSKTSRRSSVLLSDCAAARRVSACSRAERSVSRRRAFSIAMADWVANAVASSASSSV